MPRSYSGAIVKSNPRANRINTPGPVRMLVRNFAVHQAQQTNGNG
jgi:hypothetical protein